jgi:hypothetical protein
MKKKTENTFTMSRPRRLDWKPLMAAFQDALEWALDVAADFARGYPDEVAAVERVRDYLLLSIAGFPVDEPSFHDLAFTFALLVGAIERDRGALGKFGDLIENFPVSHIEQLSSDERRHLVQLACSYFRMQARPRVAA